MGNRLNRQDLGVATMALLVSLLLHLGLFWQGNLPLFSDANSEALQQTGVTRLSFRSHQPPPEPPAQIATPQPAQSPAPPKPRAAPQTAPPVVEPAPSQSAASAAADSAEQLKAREHYLGRVLAHIEAHKFYPQRAQRRGVQGVIHVSFRLHADGYISELQVEQGHAVLRQAAQDTIRAALPLPAHSEPRPLLVRFGMEFKLQ